MDGTEHEILLEREADLLSHYPYYFLENQEINAICDALNPEFNLFISRARKALNNLLPGTADEDGIERYETWLELETDPSKPLEERRGQVLAKLNETLPYTEIRLQKILAAIVGWDHFTYKRDGAFVEVEIDDTVIDKWVSVYDMLQRVLPLNLHFKLNSETSRNEQGYVYGVGTMITQKVVNEIDNTERESHLKFAMDSRLTRIIETELDHSADTAKLAIGVGSMVRETLETPAIVI